MPHFENRVVYSFTSLVKIKSARFLKKSFWDWLSNFSQWSEGYNHHCFRYWILHDFFSAFLRRVHPARHLHFPHGPPVCLHLQRVGRAAREVRQVSGPPRIQAGNRVRRERRVFIQSRRQTASHGAGPAGENLRGLPGGEASRLRRLLRRRLVQLSIGLLFCQKPSYYSFVKTSVIYFNEGNQVDTFSAAEPCSIICPSTFYVKKIVKEILTDNKLSHYYGWSCFVQHGYQRSQNILPSWSYR